MAEDYGQDRELAKQFLADFSNYDDETGLDIKKYEPQLTKLANREIVHIIINMIDVEQFNHAFAKRIENEVVMYRQVFYQALDELLPNYKTKDIEFKDVMDVFIEQRLLIAERNKTSHNKNIAPSTSQPTNQGKKVDLDGQYPPDLIRTAELSFKPASLQATPIREVLADKIGKLITVRGIVTRATDVKPKVTIVTYTCDLCGNETFQPVSGPDFTPLFQCSSSACKAQKAIGRITMQTRGSKFVKYQEVKLQEHSDQVPTGDIPRTVTIHVYGELTRLCNPGDHVSISGVYVSPENQGYQRRGSNQTAPIYIEAHCISQMNKTEDDELNTEPMSMEDAEELARGEGNFLTRLSSSIAPEIYGHEELKKALLLLLVGGVDRSPQGMRIRGNINICLMGDPGVAKSQLLSFIDRLAARSQFTTGRGSSGVGLTAAVLRDPISNELVLEGGAMVLADQGICCIDEFDKMMDADRTAIHEVMEQQTVSIAKAGIMTTLNARVSILAAANPAYGRYNIHRDVTDNLQLPPALLSRFDLLWLIRDHPTEANDLNLADHITTIHRFPDQPVSNNVDAIDMKIMRRFIALCKLKNPTVPVNLTDMLVKCYTDIRSKARVDGINNKNPLFTSPRTLLAIIRLSTAFARLRLSEEVDELDVKAAVKLYNASKESIEGARDNGPAPLSLLDIIREKSRAERKREFTEDELVDVALERGFSKDQIDKNLEQLTEWESIIYDEVERTVFITEKLF